MPPEIILGRDDDPGEAARELLDLAGESGRVEVRTGRSGPAFEVDDATYGRWSRRHEASSDEQAVNRAADADAEFTVTSDDELPTQALNADPATVDAGDVAGDLDGDELPRSAVNADPPANGDAPDSPDGDQADEQPAPRKATARKATTSTRSRSGSGK